MSTKKPAKKPLPSSAEFALNGAGHREQEHRPRAKKTHLEKNEKPVTATGGRPKTFQGETERVPIILPADLALKLRLEAVKRKQCPSQIVASLFKTASPAAN